MIWDDAKEKEKKRKQNKRKRSGNKCARNECAPRKKNAFIALFKDEKELLTSIDDTQMLIE